MTAAMQSIILGAAQVEHINKTGELVVFDAIEEQPPEDANKYITAADGSGDVKFASLPCDSIHVARTDWLKPPVAPGERLSVKPCGWHHPTGARHAMRKKPQLTLVVASVEPVEHKGKWCWRQRLEKVEADDA